MKRLASAFVLTSVLVFAAAPEPPALRLARAVEPQRMAVDLRLRPTDHDFSGTVDIDLKVNESVSHFWLNGSQLTIAGVKLTTSDGSRVPVTTIPGGEQFIGFQLSEPLRTGEAHLTISYKGAVNLRSSVGIFSSSRNGEHYLFTQFEPIDARSAFPCFDEPSFKIPWQLTLHVPQADQAVSNTAIESETNESDGLKVVRFRATKPLPSYLVAFGVGPFEFVPAGTAGKNKIPVRIVVPRGDSARAAYAASVTAAILTRLEDYFGIPFPYDKSDQLAVPLSFGGAMENPGLVTFDENILVAPPQGDMAWRQHMYTQYAAHELAHQWTGDLVTMNWWNDVWLNESFATWMESKLVAEWKPEWRTRADDQASRLQAADVDTKISARRINQPAESLSDIESAFDGITYQKGGSVLATFENAVGADRFQQIVHDYLQAHRFGNASSDDFLQQLGRGTNAATANAFGTFLNQTGVPKVSFQLRCKRGADAQVATKQERLLPIGSAGSAKQTWGIPICVAYSSAGKRKEACQVVSGESDTVPLPGSGCPAWFLGNSRELGYYIASYEPAALQNLQEHWAELSLAERVGLLGDVHVLSAAGVVPWGESLALVSKLKNDSDPKVIGARLRLASVSDHYLTAADSKNYAKFLQAMFGVKGRALGWKTKPGDSDEELQLRQELVPFLAIEAEDSELIAQAKELANQWFTDRNVVSSDVLSRMLFVAARNSGPEFYNKLLAAAKAEEDPLLKPLLVAALGGVRDETLMRRTVELVFGEAFDMRVGLFALNESNVALTVLADRYQREHYDDIIAKMPNVVTSGTASRFPRSAVIASCSNEAAEQTQAFYADRMKKVLGGERALAIAVERIHLCAAARPAATGQIARFLAGFSDAGVARSGAEISGN